MLGPLTDYFGHHGQPRLGEHAGDRPCPEAAKVAAESKGQSC